MIGQIAPKTVAQILSQTPLLSKCELSKLENMACGSRQENHRAGQTIMEAGAVGTALGFILQGKAGLFLNAPGKGRRHRVEMLQPGDFYGEAGFFIREGSPLQVTAKEDTLVLVVEREQLVPLIAENPRVALLLAKEITERLQNTCRFAPAAASHTAPTGPVQVVAPTPAPMRPPTPATPAPGELEEGQIAWVDAGAYKISHKLLEMIPTKLIRDHRLLPLELMDRVLTVGMVNPMSAAALADLRRVLHTVDPHIVAISVDDFTNTFVRLKLNQESSKEGASGQETKNATLTYRAEIKKKEEEKAQLFIGNEVVSLFDQILAEAVGYGASDIHIQPDATGVRVRYRVSGNLIEREDFIPDSYAAPLVARIKVLSELDLTEHRLPQDGRIGAHLGRRELNLRVSTMAIARGEKAVIRIIDPEDVMRPMHQVFMNPDLGKMVAEVSSEPYGAVVVAGPTGSGKSCTLYSILNNRLRTRPDNNLVTVEDPVEYLVPGMTQVSVNPKVGMSFAAVLRGLMRQDPDVIMIGELRDKDTANIMVEASLTGHMVLTSTHGNDAMAVFQRLFHFDLDPVILSQAISCVVVQRLVGRLCPGCVEERDVAPALVESLIARKVLQSEGAAKLPTAVGCEQCGQTGYMGRVAVQEVLRLDEEVRGILAQGATPKALLSVARERGKFTSFAQAAAYLMARKMVAPCDAMLVTSG